MRRSNQDRACPAPITVRSGSADARAGYHGHAQEGLAEVNVFKAFERHVLRTLLRTDFSTSQIATILGEAELVSFEHTGAGYFLTVGHPSLPSRRVVYNKPFVAGRSPGVHCGFVLFLEDGKLTLECHGYPTREGLSGDVPLDIRDHPLKIESDV